MENLIEHIIFPDLSYEAESNKQKYANVKAPISQEHVLAIDYRRESSKHSLNL